jgi:two-component system CheB/CheR fusion protein
VDKKNALAGVCITFTDVSRLEELQKDLDRARSDLESAYEELQSTNEELTTTNEELHSTVEELETTNEELQSTNEELETMNAELQSTNEELVTGNEQLRERDTEVMMVNRLLQSVLTGLTSAVVVLDEKACVMNWAPQAQELWGLTFDEVRGRSFFSLDIGLPVKELQDVIRNCLNDAAKSGPVELDAINRRGKAIRCRITCSPLAGSQERGKGAILYMGEVEGGGRS